MTQLILYLRVYFSLGLGLQLLVDTMRMLSPSHVIQLWCKQKHQNCGRIDDRFHLQTSWQDLTKVSTHIFQGLHRPGKVLEFDLGPGKLLECEISAICPRIL